MLSSSAHAQVKEPFLFSLCLCQPHVLTSPPVPWFMSAFAAGWSPLSPFPDVFRASSGLHVLFREATGDAWPDRCSLQREAQSSLESSLSFSFLTRSSLCPVWAAPAIGRRSPSDSIDPSLRPNFALSRSLGDKEKDICKGGRWTMQHTGRRKRWNSFDQGLAA